MRCQVERCLFLWVWRERCDATRRDDAMIDDERDDAMIDDGLSMFSHDARVGF